MLGSISRLNGAECEDGDWINLAHDKDKWRDVLKSITNFRLP
jgi:hypothetical protein